MRPMAQIGRIHPVRQPGHPGRQLARDLDVVALNPVEGAHPEARADLEQRELTLAQRSHRAGEKGAAGGAAVQLAQEICVGR